jgi:hypothetical protein
MRFRRVKVHDVSPEELCSALSVQILDIKKVKESNFRVQKVGTSVAILVQKFLLVFHFYVSGGFFISPCDGGDCEVLIFVGGGQAQFMSAGVARDYGKRLVSLFEEVAEANEWGFETLEVG